MKNPFCKTVKFMGLFLRYSFSHLIGFAVLLVPLALTGRDAPVTTGGSVASCANIPIVIPVTVANFTSVSAISLRLDFNPALLTYVGYSNINSSLNGMFINMVPVSPTLSKVMISFTSIIPKTLTDGSKLMDLTFTIIGDNPTLQFNNTASGGIDCEYADETSNPMVDIPTENFYINPVITNLTPALPGPVLGPAGACLGTQQSYYVTGLPDIIYTWSVPSGWFILSGQNTDSITVSVGANAGTITVTPSNMCGNGPAQTLAVSYFSVPLQPSAVTGEPFPCRGTTQGYGVEDVPGVSYFWTVPSDWLIVNGQGSSSILAEVGSASGSVTAVPNNQCGAGPSASLSVTGRYVIANAGADQSIPYGNSTTLSGVATSGSGSYIWQWEPAALLLNAGVQNPLTVNLTASVMFMLTVSDAVTGCSASDAMNVFVTGGPLTITAYADPGTICEGQSSQLSALPGGGTGSYTYLWNSDPPGFTSTMQNPVVQPTISTNYTVQVSDGITTESASASVHVDLLPEKPEQPTGPVDVDLYYSTSSQYATSVTVNAQSYFWELIPQTIGVIIANGIQAEVQWFTTGNAKIVVRAANGCGETTSDTTYVSVDNTTSTTDITFNQFTVGPNPFGDYISFSTGADLVVYSCDLTDISGKIILGLQNSNAIINTTRIERGIYFVRTLTNKGLIIKKVMKL